MGKGEVWIDDVQLFDLWFSKNERNELTKNIALADLHLGEGQVGDCLQFLDGYWPRFLKRHVPFDQPRVAASPAQRNRAADQAAPKSQQGPPREKPRSFLDRWRHLAPRKVLPF
jgi:hypothetical protein